ncbi:hypothetical protein FDUTEX481_06879 [Tolypothrix sp. PCC 7601]|nr:hypothetical protein FDUTEX481_06879 [Tolypothrix sp. PCC 7601]
MGFQKYSLSKEIVLVICHWVIGNWCFSPCSLLPAPCSPAFPQSPINENSASLLSRKHNLEL